jgi:two-component system, NarL family, sensor kinase
MLVFVLLGLVALTVVGAVGVLVLRRLATDQAIDEARQVTTLSARVVEHEVTDGLLTGDAGARGDVASVVVDAVLHDPIVRVKLWTQDGTIVYSDEARLIGARYELGADELQVLRDGGVTADVSDLNAPENRFERPFGELLEVYTPISTPNGTPLLFETYQRSASISASGSDLLGVFAPVLLAALIAFAVLLIPLAWILAHRVQRAQRDQERLLERAIDVRDRERRRIASDLHDGPVQELAGVAMQLSARAARSSDAASHDALADSASAVRGSVRTLRSAIVGIYPPNLQQAGLGPALSDLTARLDHEGLAVSLHVDAPDGFTPEVDEVLYRACQEALRNVEAHAGASTVEVVVRGEGDRAVLEVIDDGRGLATSEIKEDLSDGHFGLQILRDMVLDAGGDLTLGASASGGTIVRVEVPA